MPLDSVILFFATAALLALTPGPDNLFVLTQSLAFGSRAGILVTLGLCSGLIFHTSLVAFGLAALLATSAQVLILIKLVGAAYLLYLAWLSWRDSSGGIQRKPQHQLGYWALYRRGVIMNSTNPKVALFFLAFLPQFIDVKYGEVVYQVIELGVLFMLATILVFGGIALLAGRYSQRLNQSAHRRLLLHRAISTVFVLLSLNLLLNLY